MRFYYIIVMKIFYFGVEFLKYSQESLLLQTENVFHEVLHILNDKIY